MVLITIVIWLYGSLQNSLGPRRDWLEVRGKVLRPRTALSWLLARWVVGESEEATHRTLSSHGPENPEEKEFALSVKKWVPEIKRNTGFSSWPSSGEKYIRYSRHLLRRSKLQNLRVACIRAALLTFWTTWGLDGTWGAPLSCERLDAPA